MTEKILSSKASHRRPDTPLYKRKQEPRILVVRTDRIGDVVMMTPLLRALRQTFLHSYIAALVHPRAYDVLLHNPHLNELFTDGPELQHSGREGFWRQVKCLRNRRFDIALLLLPTERLAWMLFAAGIPRRYGVGVKFYGVVTGMKTVRRKYVPLRHEADYCLDFGRALGVTSSDLSPEVFLTSEEREEGRTLLLERGIRSAEDRTSNDVTIVGIHATSGHSAPNWKPQRYAELCHLLIQQSNAQLVVTGIDDGGEAQKHFEHFSPTRVINFMATKLTLRQLMSIISHQRVLVSASTGPMHLAAAMKVPTVSLFCPMPNTSAVHWGPLGNQSIIVEPSDGFCSHRCPGDPHVCEFEGGIEPRDVAAAVLNILGVQSAIEP